MGACILVLAVLASAPSAALTPGTGFYDWQDATGESDPSKDIRVFYYRPTTITPDTPVWVIMHGSSRNADDYRDYFVSSAAAQGAIVIAPRFTTADWSGSLRYNLGYVGTAQEGGTPRAENLWSFSKIEPMFDDLLNTREPTLNATTYSMFGHSAGSQFTHRFLMYKPDARVNQAVAANAGWYTMAQYAGGGTGAYSSSFSWPYNLTGTAQEDATSIPFPASQLENMLGDNITVLLAEEDLGTSGLRTTTQANAQGARRFHRGQFFYAEGQAEAANRSVPFGWDMQFVNDINHSGSNMAKRAAFHFRYATGPQPEAANNFQFDDSNGTGLDSALDSGVDALNWDAAIAGVTTDGSGALDVAYSSTTLANTSIALPASRLIDGTTNNFGKMIVDIEPWEFTGGAANEEFRIGLYDKAVGVDPVAEIRLLRSGADQITLIANSSGSFDSEVIAEWGASQTSPVTFTLEFDAAAEMFMVSYDDASATHSRSFHTGPTGLGFDANYMNMAFKGTFDDPSEEFKISSVQLMMLIPEQLLAADFDENGTVDGDDLAKWEGDFSLNDDSDADGDGDSDGADFLIWQQQHGMSSSPLAAVAGVVPEPGACALALLVAVFHCAFRVRRDDVVR